MFIQETFSFFFSFFYLILLHLAPTVAEAPVFPLIDRSSQILTYMSKSAAAGKREGCCYNQECREFSGSLWQRAAPIRKKESTHTCTRTQRLQSNCIVIFIWILNKHIHTHTHITVVFSGHFLLPRVWAQSPEMKPNQTFLVSFHIMLSINKNPCFWL